jgi:hypothetical protein
MYPPEIDNRVVVVGIASKDQRRAPNSKPATSFSPSTATSHERDRLLPEAVSLGTAGVDVPLTVYHEGVTFDVVLSLIDRAKLPAPRTH